MSKRPNLSDDYRYAPGPSKALLDEADWNRVFGDVGGRLRALEGKRTELQDLLDDLSFNGQARIDQAITPLIERVRADIVAVQGLVEQVITDAANAAAEVTAEVRGRVAKVETDLVAVEAEIARILSGQLPAANVTESDDRRFVSTAQREHLDAAAPLASPALTGNPTAPTAAIGDNDTTIATTAFVQRDARRLAHKFLQRYGG